MDTIITTAAELTAGQVVVIDALGVQTTDEVIKVTGRGNDIVMVWFTSFKILAVAATTPVTVLA